MAPAVSEDDLNEEFSTFGLDLDDPDVVDKLKELCTVHKLDASEILDEWIAFGASKKNIKLNPESLDLLDRERLAKRAPRTPITKKTESRVYDVNSINEVISGIDEDAAESLYNAYSTPSAKANPTQKRQHTPDNPPPIKRFTGLTRSPHIPFSPATFSPSIATPSKKYSSRSNAGEVELCFGDTRSANWKGEGCDCYIAPYDPSNVLKEQFKYMFQKLSEKAHVLNDLIDEMGAQLQVHHNIEEFSHVACPVQDSVTVVGRVCCDSEGRLNSKSVVLEGSRDSSSGKMIPVDLSQLKEYSLFPGQIVALDGVNNTGQKFVAKKLYQGVQLPIPVVKVKTEAGSSLNFIIAAGPYSTSDCLSYEPLTDLMKYIQRDKPDVCILTGPFVDCENQEIKKGTIQVTFEELFNRQMTEIEKIAKVVGCQMIIVPSSRDVHHDSVYPQPPFNRTAEKNVHYVSDPSTLQINGVVFGITSTDVLLHLGTEEISYPPGSSDKLGRLSQHLIMQQSYYPLYPSCDDISIDFEKYEVFAKMPVTPHVLIIPSNLKFFVKDIKGCCCINPGWLAKGQTGGTYARVALKVNSSVGSKAQSLVKNIAVEIIRT